MLRESHQITLELFKEKPERISKWINELVDDLSGLKFKNKVDESRFLSATQNKKNLYERVCGISYFFNLMRSAKQLNDTRELLKELIKMRDVLIKIKS